MESSNENSKLEREKLIQHLISSGYLKSERVIKAMRKVPRHEFLPPQQERHAYEDCPLIIGSGQTISAPHMVAIMTEALEVGKKDKILEVGSGSGYQAAILAELASQGEIYTMETILQVKEFAEKNLSKLGYKNVVIILGDGTKGYQEKAPYDKIMVTAAAPKIPSDLIQQLRVLGKLLVPVGGRMYQELISVEKKENKIEKKNLGGCVFVPLVGKDGW